MPTYSVIRKSDQAEVCRYQADQPIEWIGLEFAGHDHIEVPADPPPAPAPVDPAVWHITKLAFRSRFTAAERAAITLAARQATAQGAAVQSYLDDVQAATYIDLQRPDTRAGVMGLEAAGLLAAGRAAAILDTTPTEQELFRG